MVLYCILYSSGHSDPIDFEKIFPEINIITNYIISLDYRLTQSNAIFILKNTNGFFALNFAKDRLIMFELSVLP